MYTGSYTHSEKLCKRYAAILKVDGNDVEKCVPCICETWFVIPEKCGWGKYFITAACQAVVYGECGEKYSPASFPETD